MRLLLRALRMTVPFLTTFSGVMNPGVAYAEPSTAGERAAEIAEAIDQAKASVDVMSRNLAHVSVQEALAQAAARGVLVRVLLEGKEFEGEPAPGSCKNLQDADSHLDECLAQAGQVDLRYLYSAFADSQKIKIATSYLVVDGKRVLVSGESLKTIKSKKAVKTFVTRFDRAFAQGREPFRRLAVNDGVCGRLKPVSAELGSMRRLKAYMASCDQ